MLPSPRLALLAVVLTCAGLVTSVSAAASTGSPRMWPHDSGVRRGSGTTVFGSGLEASTSYQLSADEGGFFQEGTSNAISWVTTSSAGAFQVSYHMPADLAATVDAVHLTATPTDNAAVTTTITVGPPVLGHGARGRVCASLLGDFTLDGLPPGDYVVSSPKITLPAAPMTVSNARLAFSGTPAADLPATTTLTATAQDGTQAAYTMAVPRSASWVHYDQLAPTPWRTFYVADCFSPGETVTFISQDAHTIAPRPVTTDSYGQAHFVVDAVNSPSPRTDPGVTATGTSSGQSAYSGNRRTYGTTLPAGSTLSHASDTVLLASPHRNYTAEVSDCDLVTRWNPWPDGGSAPAWAARGKQTTIDTCRATLGRDGNLVLLTSAGGVLWSTHTQGTGSGNHLIIQDDGNLVLRNAAGHPVWTSVAGIVRTPRAMGTGQSLTLGQALVNGATRFVLRRSGNLAVVRNGLTLWSSHTAGRGAIRLTLLGNGRLRLTTRSGRTIWSSSNSSGPYDHLIVQANGDVQVRSQFGALLWHTRTAAG